MTTLSLVLLEILSFILLKFTTAPEHVYQYSYLTRYKYDPYIAFRSDSFPAFGSEKELNEDSLVILGGSTAIGVGTNQHERKYFVLMQNYFYKNPKFGISNIINYGVPGYVSTQESITYKNFIFSKLKSPKLVVSLTSFNDTYFYLFRTLDVGNHEFNYAIDLIFRKGYPDPSQRSERIKNAVRRSHIFSIVHALTQKQADGSVPPIMLSSDISDPYQAKYVPVSNEIIESAAQNFLSNVLSTAILAKSKGTKYLVLLQPNYLYGGQLTLKDNEWFNNMPALNKWIEQVSFQKPGYDKFYEKVISGLEDYKQKGLLDYFDYRDLLKSAGPAYADPVHFNEIGSEIFAKQLLKDINIKIFKNTNYNNGYEL